MRSKIKGIEEEALKLPSHERARLAEQLISSLDELRAKGSKEKVKAKPADLVFKEARSKLE
ncbi:MAG: hypothetical protein EFT35_02225 [Methanophagales archaeon ANME-1-THS]|nr:MAG: hypothetical protein EFT35_02225 [Methanophagales archaeon ANME-1-THS]